jgi:hypothetical protein
LRCLFLRYVANNYVSLRRQVPMVYNAEEMMGSDGEGMVAIGMVEEDDAEDGQHQQVQIEVLKPSSANILHL